MSTSLVLAVCALGAAIGRALIVVGWAIDGPLFAQVLRKLLAGGDLARGVKLCDAIGTPLGAAAKRAIVVARGLSSDASDVRAKAEIEAAFTEAYAPIGRLRTSRRWTALSLVLAASAIGVSLAGGGSSLGAIGVAAIALLIAILGWSEVRAEQTLAAGPRALDVLTELLVSSRLTRRDEPEAEPLAALFFGFDERSPEGFFDALAELAARLTRLQRDDAIEVRLHARDGAPRHVVSAWGSKGALRALRDALEREAPRAEIAPDASYGPETRTHAALVEELSQLRPLRSRRGD